jgi:hypothetical protein
MHPTTAVIELRTAWFDRRICMRRRALITVCATLLSCERPQSAYRGAGLGVAALPLQDQVQVYRAALGGSFRLDDPTLSILADTTLLPRDAGLSGGEAISPDLLAALRNGGVVKGVCKVPEQRNREALICDAARAGYVARFSAPFAKGRDSVQVHLVVQQYATPTGPRAERMRFERAYQLARTGSTWRAVREARLAQP